MTLISNYQLLTKMHELAQKSSMHQKTSNSTDQLDRSSGDFQNLLTDSLNKVNELQIKTNQLIESYQHGEDVSLAELMVAQQKSSIALTGAITVRNKFVQAYQDIMNMPL